MSRRPAQAQKPEKFRKIGLFAAKTGVFCGFSAIFAFPGPIFGDFSVKRPISGFPAFPYFLL